MPNFEFGSTRIFVSSFVLLLLLLSSINCDALFKSFSSNGDIINTLCCCCCCWSLLNELLSYESNALSIWWFFKSLLDWNISNLGLEGVCSDEILIKLREKKNNIK